jgi:putative DNA primase/helicase
MGHAALASARLGLAVVPEHEPAGRDGCTCGCNHPHCWRRAKHPRIEGWERRATTDEAVLRSWWRRWPNANIGLVLEPSRLVVLDVDLRDGHHDRLGELARRFGPGVLDTLTASTGGGGWHLFYLAPRGVSISTRKDFLGPGLDVQYREGLVTIPPSLHPSGRRYAWKDGRGPATRPPAELPPALLAALTARPSLLWYLRQAPYWLADRLHLSLDRRQRLRAVQARVVTVASALRRRMPGR